MKTYRAALAPWRLRPIHPNYVARAKAAARLLGVRRGHAYETTCPYCGVADQLVGVVRIGAKSQEEGVAMTSDGYTVSGGQDKDRDIQIIYCQAPECGAAIDPLAYLNPAVFYAQYLNIDPFDLR